MTAVVGIQEADPLPSLKVISNGMLDFTCFLGVTGGAAYDFCGLLSRHL